MTSQEIADSVGTADTENMQTADDDTLDQSHTDDPVIQTCDFSTKTWREDMALVVEGRKLFVASNILSLMSPVFTAMFEEQFKEKGPREIELTGKTFDDVAEFLRCLYPNVSKKITEDNVFAVLPLSDEFKVKQLKQSCEDFLVVVTNASSSPGNVCKYLQLAIRYNMDTLRGECLKIATSIHQDKLATAEKNYPLPLEIKVELQERQIQQLRENISKLKKKQKEKTELLKNLEDCVKHFWVEKGKKTEFSHSRCRVGSLKLKISDVSRFTETHSPGVRIHGIDWVLSAEKKKDDDGKEHLDAFLYCEVPEEWQNWSCEVMGKIIMTRHDACQTYQVDEGFLNSFTQESDAYGYTQFIPMKELLFGDKYVVNGSAELKVFFLVKEPVCKTDTGRETDTESDGN